MPVRPAHLALIAAALASACRGGEAAPPSSPSTAALTAPVPPAPAAVVDSILPVDEELRRFRVGLGPAPTALAGGAGSRQALVDSFAVAIRRADTAALRKLVVTRAEFAYLVYPGSAYTHPPYRQSPALVWMQLAEAGAKGETRLLRRLGGRRLELAGHSCDATPERYGPTRLWRGCVVRVVQPDGGVRDVRLFGVIVERDGRFKFASLANRL